MINLNKSNEAILQNVERVDCLVLTTITHMRGDPFVLETGTLSVVVGNQPLLEKT